MDTRRHPRWMAVVGVTAAVLLSACSSPAPEAPQPTATPKAPTGFVPTQVPPDTGSTTTTEQPKLGAMLAAFDVVNNAGFHGMETDLKTAMAVHMSGPALGVQHGLDAISALGLHDLATTLQAMTGPDQINSRTAGQVKNALAVVGAVPWPAEVAAEQTAARTSLEALRDALVAADLPGAQHAAEEAHETTHDLSTAAYDWLGQQSGVQGSGAVAVLGAYSGLDAIGALGLHGLETSLKGMTNASEISSRTAGQVKNTLAVVNASPWPEEVATEVAEAKASLEVLRDALVAADLPGAQHAAEEAHEKTHDLSTAAYGWLGQQSDAQGSGALAVLGSRAGIDAIGALGLHDLATSLQAMTGPDQINSRSAGQVKNALAVVGAVPWPEEVATEATAARMSLEELRDALTAADLPAAQHAAEEAHEKTHDLSTAAYEWLGRQDGAALMGGLINTRFVGQVRNAVIALGVGQWEDEAAAGAAKLREALTALEQALVRNDVEAAVTAAEGVHEVQHDFSTGLYAWMSNNRGMQADVGAVMAGMDLIGQAGLHELEQALEAATSAQDITSRQGSQVKNALVIAQTVAWPSEFSAEADKLVESMTHLVDALAKADLVAARAAAEEVHEANHDFSMATYEWLEANKGAGADKGAALAAMRMIDAAGLHAMEEAHHTAASHADIPSGDARVVKQTLTVAQAVGWHTSVDAEAQAFLGAMEKAHDAMTRGDLAGCQGALEEVHSAQHDFNKAVYAWLQ